MKSGANALFVLFSAILFVLSGILLGIIAVADILRGNVKGGILTVIPAVLCIAVSVCFFITFRNKMKDDK